MPEHAGEGRSGVEEWADACRQALRRARAEAPAQAQAQRARARARQTRAARAAARRAAAAAAGTASPEVRSAAWTCSASCCIALAVYLGYVIYLGWNGGAVGNGAETGLAYAVGKGAVVFPVALALGGLGLIMRPLMPSPGAIAVGAFAICAGLLLALAAQTAGLAPGGTREELFAARLLPASTAAASARSSTGPAPRSSSGSAPTSSPCCS